MKPKKAIYRPDARSAFQQAAERLALAQDAMTEADRLGRGRCLNYVQERGHPSASYYEPGSPSCDLFNDDDEVLCEACLRKRQNRINFFAHRHQLSKARAAFRRAWAKVMAAR